MGANWEVYPVEFSGDRFTDLFLHTSETGQWFKAINDGAGDFTCDALGRLCQEPPSSSNTWMADLQMFPGDFNGDGLSDLLLYEIASGARFVAFSTPDGFTFVAGTSVPGRTPRIADFDGDGLDDVFSYDFVTGVWSEELSDGVGGFTVIPGIASPGWQIFVMHIFPLEDRRADLLFYSESTGYWFGALNTGPGTFEFDPGVTSLNLDVFAEAPARVPPSRSR